MCHYSTASAVLIGVHFTCILAIIIKHPFISDPLVNRKVIVSHSDGLYFLWAGLIIEN